MASQRQTPFGYSDIGEGRTPDEATQLIAEWAKAKRAMPNQGMQTLGSPVPRPGPGGAPMLPAAEQLPVAQVGWQNPASAGPMRQDFPYDAARGGWQLAELETLRPGGGGGNPLMQALGRPMQNVFQAEQMLGVSPVHWSMQHTNPALAAKLSLQRQQMASDLFNASQRNALAAGELQGREREAGLRERLGMAELAQKQQELAFRQDPARFREAMALSAGGGLKTDGLTVQQLMDLARGGSLGGAAPPAGAPVAAKRPGVVGPGGVFDVRTWGGSGGSNMSIADWLNDLKTGWLKLQDYIS